MKTISCVFLHICLFGSILYGPALGGEYEYRLTKYLLSNYEPSVLPVENSSTPLDVSLGVSLHHIIDVDEKNQIITTNCWITQTWRDTHLTWNASDFGGIRTIRLPFDRVWRPDIILYNNADSNYNNAIINTNVIVMNDGYIVWLSHGIYKSSCNISVEYFPFDIQTCKMKWASWTYDGLAINIHAEGETGDTSNYQANGEFVLEGFQSQRNVVNYTCNGCDAPYPDITFTIIIRRRPLFYVFNLILPCVLINGIALLVFYVPSESGEKVTLGISALLSMTVFLMTIRESLPPTEKTPLISLYYGVSICLVSFASAMAVVTLNIHHRGIRGNEVPPSVKNIILNQLGKLFFFQFDSDTKERIIPPPHFGGSISSGINNGSAGAPEHSMMTLNRSATLTRPTQRADPYLVPSHGMESTCWNNADNHIGSRRSFSVAEDHPHFTEDGHFCQLNGGLSVPPPLPSEPNISVNFMERISASIEKAERRIAQSEHKDLIEAQWKQVSLIIDRLLLLVFFLAMSIASLVILTSSPHLYDTGNSHPSSSATSSSSG
ncbi:neuronal acetylcholine receptor subunit alpha-10 isoform X3 [Lepeophtheirus salmonis]|uniref:neuronal acetylcholine receptor subunit alpha-10 isoform X3 n=1 Tax=Lepeophtheirus salmonis TaxID=72036 RepID=UPI003AF39C7B